MCDWLFSEVNASGPIIHSSPISCLNVMWFLKSSLTSIVSISVLFLIGKSRYISPSAGMGNSISSASVGEGRTDEFDVWAPSSTISCTFQFQGFCICCITDTWTDFCWSSNDNCLLSYVDIFSYKSRENRWKCAKCNLPMQMTLSYTFSFLDNIIFQTED